MPETPPQAGRGGLRIIALAPNEWDGLWMNRQHLLSRLARRYPILYSTGARSTWDAEFPSIGPGGLLGRFGTRDGVVIDYPPLLPLRVPRIAALDAFAIRSAARRWRRELRRFGRAPLVAYLFHPVFRVFLEALRPDYVVYHAYDLLTRMPSWNAASERQLELLLLRADRVLASSRVIAEKLRERSGRTVHVVPNGVDFDAFARPDGPEPEDLRAVPRPRIAHVGRLNRKVDIELVSALARRNPQWSLVLVGPVVDLDAHTAALYERARQIPNLYLLGEKSRTELPRYLHAVDVGLLAYRTGVLWTEGIYPLKLHEYLASGLPIVSADIPSVREFPDVVRVATTPDEWGAGIEAALADTTPERRKLRVETARANSWPQRAAVISEMLRTLVGEPAAGGAPASGSTRSAHPAPALPAPPRVLTLTADGDDYTTCFLAALRRAGVEVHKGVWSGRWLYAHVRPHDVISLQYPSFLYYDASSRLRTWLNMPRYVALLLALRARGARITWIAHNLYPHDGGRAELAHRVGRYAVVKLASLIGVHGESSVATVQREFKVPASKLVLLEHGHWIGFFANRVTREAARERLGISQDSFVFLSIGTCKPYRNLEHLLRSHAAMPDDDSLLWIVGRFPSKLYCAQVKETARLAAVDRITIRDEFVARDDMQIYLNACDVVVLPYREILTSGVAMLAVSFGRPVVAPALGSLRELVTDDCGVLYDPRSDTALSAALRAARGRRFSSGSIIHRAQQYSWDRSARVYAEWIRALR